MDCKKIKLYLWNKAEINCLIEVLVEIIGEITGYEYKMGGGDRLNKRKDSSE